MIRINATIICDLCYNQFGPTFLSEFIAKRWIENLAEDYEEFGPFCDGVTPRFSTIFHRVGNKVICKRCTEIEIAKTKRVAK